MTDARRSSIGELAPVFDVLKKINSELDLPRLIGMILDTMIEFCNAMRGRLVLFEGGDFRTEVARDRAKKDLGPAELGLSRTVLQRVRDSGQTFRVRDAQRDVDVRSARSVTEQNLLSILCVPLVLKSRLLGAVYLDNPEMPDAFGDYEVQIAEVLTGHAAIALDNAMLHARSIHDALTLLYNHSHFERCLDVEIQRSRRSGRPCGLLILDLDDFKKINDTYGHEAGSDVLRGVAQLIGKSTRSMDSVARVEHEGTVVARYGGDEFEILLPEADAAGIVRVSERLLSQLAATRFPAGKHPIDVRCSIGGACHPRDADEARALILKADEALYAAKKAGKGRFVAWTGVPSRPA